jgi:hypothetical protein
MAEAERVLGALECPEGASVASFKAWFAMLERDNDAAAVDARRALALAENWNYPEARTRALNSLGCALILMDDLEGIGHLERAAAIAAEAGNDSQVASAFMSLGSALGEMYYVARAESYLERGIQYALDRGHGQQPPLHDGLALVDPHVAGEMERSDEHS